MLLEDPGGPSPGCSQKDSFPGDLGLSFLLALASELDIQYTLEGMNPNMYRIHMKKGLELLLL
jgi:hypothetical protein